MTSRNKSILFFTMHKSASTFIYRLAGKLSSLGGFRYYSINKHTVFNKRSLDEQDPKSWKEKGCCFAPLRSLLPSIDKARLINFNIILHLRDPRDVLVSLFFSRAYSHPIVPGKFEPTTELRKKWIDEGIDKFLLDKQGNNQSAAENFFLRYKAYCDNLLNKPNVIVVKYEDMISDFENWLRQIMPPFNIADTEKVIRKLVQEHRNAFEAPKEDVFSHKRQVASGDHKRKLSQETIDQLNSMFKDVLQKLKYEL